MPTYEDLVELANICARHARCATNEAVVIVLSKMAKKYQAEAAKLDSGGAAALLLKALLLALAQ